MSGWTKLNGGETAPLSIRIVIGNQDVWLDLAGGCRIPKVVERAVRSVDDLRASDGGIHSVLLLHDGAQQSSNLFKIVLTMFDSHVIFEVAQTTPGQNDFLIHDIEEARCMKRNVTTVVLAPEAGFVDEFCVPFKTQALM